MKCDRCGAHGFVTFERYRVGKVMIKHGWLCGDCKFGVSEIK